MTLNFEFSLYHVPLWNQAGHCGLEMIKQDQLDTGIKIFLLCSSTVLMKKYKHWEQGLSIEGFSAAKPMLFHLCSQPLHVSYWTNKLSALSELQTLFHSIS